MSISEVITWIEVTERLPEDCRTVMIRVPAGGSLEWSGDVVGVEERVWLGYYGPEERLWYSVGAEPIDTVELWAERPTGEAGSNPLIATAPKLLELARKYASECADCNGTGRGLFTPQSDKTYECPDCKDIRAVIAAAEGA